MGRAGSSFAATLIAGVLLLAYHPVTAPGGMHGERHACRSCPHHGDVLGGFRRQKIQFGFVAGARIHQAGGEFAGKRMIQTGLVAGDAGIDFIDTPFGGFLHKSGVGQERTRH